MHPCVKRLAGIALAWALLVSARSEAMAYKEVVVRDGATVTGKVRLKGAVPELRYFPLVLYPFGTYCKKIGDVNGNVQLQEFIVTDDGGMQDTIIAIDGVKAGKEFKPITTEFVAVDCMFHPSDVSPSEHSTRDAEGRVHHQHPLVAVMQNNQPLTVVNQDPIFHNGQVFQSERGNIILNFPLPISNQPFGGVVHLAPGKRIVQMICGMHEFMQTWGLMVDNPYYAKTRKGGEFSIGDLPAGTYKVTAWHPHLKPIVQEIIVRPNEKVELAFEFDAAEVHRPIFETQDKFRVTPHAEHDGLTGDSDDRILVK